MKKLGLTTALGVVGLCLTTAAEAQDMALSSDIIGADEIATIRTWLDKPVVILSVDAQNKRHATLGQDEIDALDKQWRAERQEDDQPLIAATLSNPLSNYLTQIQAASGGLYTEMFIMDQWGLNVGQSAITSDYWQGDEGKFQNTFPKGADAIFVDEAEFNEGTKTWRAQANLTITNSQNAPIGAITVEINLTELARRSGM